MLSYLHLDDTVYHELYNEYNTLDKNNVVLLVDINYKLIDIWEEYKNITINGELVRERLYTIWNSYANICSVNYDRIKNRFVLRQWGPDGITIVWYPKEDTIEIMNDVELSNDVINIYED